MQTRFARRWRLLPAAAIAGALTWQFWPAQAVRDPHLVGVWVGTPVNSAFPLVLTSSDRAKVVDIFCRGNYTRSSEWSNDAAEIRLEAEAPNVWNLAGLIRTGRFYWGWLQDGARPAERYRILELSGDSLRLQKVSGVTEPIWEPHSYHRITEAEAKEQGIL